MRYLACLFPALCLSASVLHATDPPKFSPARQEVLKVRNALRETALGRDMVAWSRHVADDCIFSDDSGELQTKAQFIEKIGKLPPEYDHSDNPHDYVIHVYGNTAVINFRIAIHEQFTDTDIISEQRQTETYIRQNGSWLLISRQWDNLPVNFRKPVPIDASAYKDYVGKYEWRAGLEETIFVKDGKLSPIAGGAGERRISSMPNGW